MMTLFVTVAGAIVGAIKELWLTSMRAKHEEQKALLAKAGIVHKDRVRAGNKQFQFTRRLIALAATASFFVMPWVVFLIYPEMQITIPERIMEGGWKFLFFEKEAKEVIKYITVPAPVVVYQFVEAYFFIIGFYFGSGGTRK